MLFEINFSHIRRFHYGKSLLEPYERVGTDEIVWIRKIDPQDPREWRWAMKGILKWERMTLGWKITPSSLCALVQFLETIMGETYLVSLRTKLKYLYNLRF